MFVTMVLNPKSAIQARGGASLLINMLCYDSELFELTWIAALERGKTRDATHPFQISMNNSEFMEIFKAFCNIPQLQI